MRKSSVIFNSSLPRHSMTEQKFGVKVTQTLDTAVTILGTTYSEFYTQTNLSYFPGQWQRACPSPKHFPPRATRGHRTPWQGLGLCLCVWEASVPLSTPAICFGGVGAWGRTSTPENSIPVLQQGGEQQQAAGQERHHTTAGLLRKHRKWGLPSGALTHHPSDNHFHLPVLLQTLPLSPVNKTFYRKIIIFHFHLSTCCPEYR